MHILPCVHQDMYVSVIETEPLLIHSCLENLVQIFYAPKWGHRMTCSPQSLPIHHSPHYKSFFVYILLKFPKKIISTGNGP